MNSIKKLSFLLAMAFGIMYVSSCTEPCDGVTCPPGYICDEGACIEDPDADPCLNVNCPAGFECVDQVTLDHVWTATRYCTANAAQAIRSNREELEEVEA